MVLIDIWEVVAVSLGITLVVIIALLIARQRQETLPTETPAPEQRQAAATRLWTLYPSLPDDEPDTALFLLEESKRTYDGWVESNAKIEGKATRLIGFLAGGAGLLTVFGSTHGDRSHLALGDVAPDVRPRVTVRLG